MSDKGKNDELLVMIILKRHDIAFSLILVPDICRGTPRLLPLDFY